VSRIVINANIIATKVHKDQTRIFPKEPYIEHCRRVAGSLSVNFPEFTNDKTIATAILHDTLEDCSYQKYIKTYASILESCGTTVAAYVELLTKPRDFQYFSNVRYLNTISVSPACIQTIKCVDRIDNLQSITQIGWSLERCIEYLDDSIAIKEILLKNKLFKQTELLNSHIIAASKKMHSTFF
jgi:(p)ppGpp synthase/HD superfamily hydrolase